MAKLPPSVSFALFKRGKLFLETYLYYVFLGVDFVERFPVMRIKNGVEIAPEYLQEKIFSHKIEISGS